MLRVNVFVKFYKEQNRKLYKSTKKALSVKKGLESGAQTRYLISAKTINLISLPPSEQDGMLLSDIFKVIGRDSCKT